MSEDQSNEIARLKLEVARLQQQVDGLENDRVLLWCLVNDKAPDDAPAVTAAMVRDAVSQQQDELWASNEALALADRQIARSHADSETLGKIRSIMDLGTAKASAQNPLEIVKIACVALEVIGQIETVLKKLPTEGVSSDDLSGWIGLPSDSQ